MKRLVSLLISISMLVSLCLIFVKADDVEENQYISAELDYFISDYYYVAETQNGFFYEGSGDHAQAIMYYLSAYYSILFAEYVLPETVNNERPTYIIPGDVFEEVASMFFDISNPDLIRFIRIYGQYDYIPGMYRVWGLSTADLEELQYVPRLYGYKDLGNGLYEAYAFLIEYDQSTSYKPGSSAVENKDYTLTPLARTTGYSTDEYGNFLSYMVSVGYMPVKVCGAVKCLIQMDDFGIPKFISFEKTDALTISSIEGVTLADLPFMNEEDKYYLALMLGAFVGLGDEYYYKNTKVLVDIYVEDSPTCKSIKKQLSASVDCSDLYVYGIYYEVNGRRVAIDEPTNLYLAYPDTFKYEPTVYYTYYVDGVRKFVELDCVVDEYLCVATAEVTKLGMFVIADVDPSTKIVRGDVTGDGNINLVDMFNLKSYVKGSMELTGKQLEAADVNADGSVDISDIFALKNIIVNRVN